MTFNEAEDFWREVLEAPNGYTADISRDMIEAALKAFETRKEYMADCEILRGACNELKKELSVHDYVATVTNFSDDSGAERAEATFNVDDFRITITVERKGEQC